MDDNLFWNSFNHRLTCSMNPETAVTHGHFNPAVFAVYI